MHFTWILYKAFHLRHFELEREIPIWILLLCLSLFSGFYDDDDADDQQDYLLVQRETEDDGNAVKRYIVVITESILLANVYSNN